MIFIRYSIRRIGGKWHQIKLDEDYIREKYILNFEFHFQFGVDIFLHMATKAG